VRYYFMLSANYFSKKPDMKKIYLLLFLFTSFKVKLSAQERSHHHAKTSKSSVASNKAVVKYGVASYYAKKFDGRKTANDEIFYSTKFTAACNQLPFDTWIRVTNLRNNKSVVVRVNDRLHPKNKRLVDLSKVAAKQIGYSGRGITRVKVEVIDKLDFQNNLTKH
jgi:rare lipoprotein A